MSTRTTSLRRPKWHPTPPPPPSPKIINLPRRTRRKQPRNVVVKPPLEVEQNYRGKLENLFGEEREFSRTVSVVLLNSSERRDRVAAEECELESSGGGGGDDGFVEEKWRFQAEILRAECNFLRIERKFALKKLERNRARMERTLRSAVQTLASGRKKIGEGKNVGVVLEEEIEDLEEKLEELQRSTAVKDLELRNCKNFDKKTSRLQRRLEKLGGLSHGKSMEGNGEMTESSLSIKTVDEIDKESSISGCKSQNKSADDLQVEILRRKMEGLSIGMLDRMEAEYGSIMSTTANSSVASSASTSKRIEFPDSSSSFSTQQMNQESMSHEEKKCSGRCKALVRKIVEQVRAETEQWSQMQEMLGQLRGEMEELQGSKEFWENRALASENEIQSLQSSVQEWRQKATSFETKANELQNEASLLKGELENLKKEEKRDVMTTKDLASNSLGKQLEKEKHVLICRVKEKLDAAETGNKQETASGKPSIEQTKETKKTKESPPISLGKQLAREKRILLCRLKENRQTRDRGSKQEVSSEGRRKAHTWNDAVMRSPLRDIGNTSTVVMQISNAIFPLHCPEPSKP